MEEKSHGKTEELTIHAAIHPFLKSQGIKLLFRIKPMFICTDEITEKKKLSQIQVQQTRNHIRCKQ